MSQPPRSSSSPNPSPLQQQENQKPAPPIKRQLRRVTVENGPLLKAAASSASLRSREGSPTVKMPAHNIVDSVAAFGNNVRVVVRVRAFLPRGK